MTRKTIDCRAVPNDVGCTLAITGEPAELVTAAVQHAVAVHGHTDTPELRAAGVAPPSRQLMVLLLGGLRELIATTVEDGADIGGITEVAVQATQALLDPTRRPAPA